MRVVQSGAFSRKIKKLHPEEKKALDRVVKKIVNDPSLGEIKVGDLAGVQVYKYKYRTQQNLLAYRYEDSKLLLTFIALGTHENFYRDLKR